jgi:membrane protease YdiL (CAAX protease family)
MNTTVSTLIRLVIPVAASLFILGVTRKRGMSWRDDLGLKPPPIGAAAGWLGLWLAWMAVSEFAIVQFGLQQAEPWPPYSATILTMRILAIGVAGPFLEELVARGVVFSLLKRTAIGPLGAVFLIAVVWASAHYRYDVPTIVLVCVDGVIFGLARYRSGSLWVPVGLHMIGNLISIVQSLWT